MPQQEQENWTDIHKEFGEKSYYSNKTYQKLWEQERLTYQDAKEWINAGFKPDDYEKVKKWKSFNFTPQEAESWSEIYLKPASYNDFLDYVKFVAYLRWKGYQPSPDLNLKKLRKEFITWYNESKPVQEYINIYYPENQRKEITNLNISEKSLAGALDLSDFVNLEELDCSRNQITNLDLGNCSSLGNLKNINLISNNFSSQRLIFLQRMVNLEKLCLGNDNQERMDHGIYNRFYGSLKPLKKLNKLERLDISNTDIDSGLEYLPESMKDFRCSVDLRKNAKVKAIYNLFANDQGVNNFPQKLKDYKQWRKLNFLQEEIREWINVDLTVADYGFANYLKKERDLAPKLAKNRLTELINEYNWRQKGFTLEQRKEWINAGARTDDYEFVAWLKKAKKLDPEWIANYQEDYQTLGKRFKEYGLCLGCNQLNTGEKWCQSCNASRLQQNFQNWTSKNQEIDQFIQKYQLAATEADKFIEWIPYEQFTDVEYLAQGGFGKVYKAKWPAGNIHHWDSKDKQWCREKDCYYDRESIWNHINKAKECKPYREVVLKRLDNSQNNTDFLDETAKHKIIDDWFNNIVPCYGISQDPETGNYLMVMQYMPEGNLRHYLSNKNWELILKDKLDQLFHIAQGLKDIHAKRLVHRDFHSGNILKGIEKTSCLITDLGLCKPVNELGEEDKVYGVLPYVAPEVLYGQPYTQASDVYSFGIIAYEVLSGLPPYYDRVHDIQLALKICQNLRPQFQIKIPQLLEDLVKKCWDADPTKRLTANELEKTLRNWEKDAEFQSQLQEAEEYNQALPEEIKNPNYKKKMHKGAVYHSRLLPTKEITKLLINDLNNQLQTKAIELNTHLMKIQQLSKEMIDFKNLAETEQKKQNDLKKALEIAFEKSDELEKIIADNQLLISEETKEILRNKITKVKKLKNESKWTRSKK